MSFTNLITIAIPCYERKEYFLYALESALNQTVRCEVIVVDNCSSHDYFKNICKEKGITYYRNDTNIGLFPNQNRCYELAETEYVKVLDDDDILLPTYVESFLNVVHKHPDIDVYYTDYYVLSKRGASNNSYTFPFGYMKNGDEIIEFGAKYNLGFPYMTAAVRKSIAILDLDKGMCIGGYDWVWVYSNFNKLTFYGNSEKLHHYRMHRTKTSRGKDWSVNLLTYSYIFEIIILRSLIDSELKKKVQRNIFWDLVNVKAHGNKKILKEIMNSDNRFGKYLKTKLENEKKIRIIFLLPKSIVNLLYFLRSSVKKAFSNSDYIK